MLLDEQAKRRWSARLHFLSILLELTQVLKLASARTACFLRDVNRFAVTAVLLLTPFSRTSPLVRLMNGVRVARRNICLWIRAHGERGPLLEYRPVWRLGDFVHEPRRSVTHFVQKRSFELLNRVEDFGAQFNARAVHRLTSL